MGSGSRCSMRETPPPLGLFAMLASLILVLVSFKVVADFLAEDELNPIVIIEVTYSVDGQDVKGEIEIELYQSDAPLHVESFVSHVEDFRYDFTEFHRIIGDFMIQGGDIENQQGLSLIHI